MKYYYVVFSTVGDPIGHTGTMVISFENDWDFTEFYEAATKIKKGEKIIKFFTEISKDSYDTYTEYLRINN